MKKITAVLLALVMLVSAVSLGSPAVFAADGEGVRFDGTDKMSILSSVSEIIFGDLNRDGRLKSADVIMLRKLLAGADNDGELSSDVGERADVNRDGRVSTRDILFLRKVIVGIADAYTEMAEVRAEYDSGENAAVIKAAMAGELNISVDVSKLATDAEAVSLHYKSDVESDGTVFADGVRVGVIDASEGAYRGAILKLPNSGCKKLEIVFRGVKVGDRVYVDSFCASAKLAFCEEFATQREESLNGSGINSSSCAVIKPESGMLSSPNNTEIAEENGCVKLTATKTSGDPYVTLDLEEQKLSADVYKYLVYVCKIPSSNRGSNPSGEIFLCAGATTGATAGRSVKFSLSADNSFESHILDLSKLTYWKGDIHSLRVDFFGNPTVGDTCYVDSIIFCKNSSDAETAAANAAALANSTSTATGGAVRDALFSKGTRDSNSSEYISGDTLYISAGTADRFTKSRFENRISQTMKNASGVAASIDVTCGWSTLKSSYDRDESAKCGVTCKISAGEGCYMAYIPIDVFVKEIIFDNDLGSDCDDGGATAMLVRAHRDGVCKVLAITSCVYNPWTPRCLKKICDYFGVYDIEIGENRDRSTLDTPDWYTCTKAPAEKYYGGVYPQFESNVALIRRLLNDSHGDVTFVTTGALSTVYALLQSDGDKACPLTGEELFKSKVGHYVCGGGNFPKGTSENNFMMDPEAVNVTVNEILWDFPVTFVGAEVSGIVRSGKSLRGRYDYILRDIYLNCPSAVQQGFETNGYFSWDHGVVYYALHGTGDGLFGVRSGYTVTPYGEMGQITISADGGRHDYVVRNASTDVLSSIYETQIVP